MTVLPSVLFRFISLALIAMAVVVGLTACEEPAGTAPTPRVDTAPAFAQAVADQTYTLGEAINALTLPAASGGNGTLSYSLRPTVPGLTFSAVTRTLTGTPTSAGSFSMTYQAIDGDTNTAASDAATRTFTITVQTPTPNDESSSTIRDISPTSVVWADGLFIVVGENGTGYSTDGETWYTNSLQVRFHDVASGGGNSVGAGFLRGKYVFFYKTDNNTWNESLTDPEYPYTTEGTRVIYGRDRFVSIGYRFMKLIDTAASEFFGYEITRESAVPVFFYSFDGIAWSEASSNPTHTTNDWSYQVQGVAYGHGRFVVVSGNVVYHSSDGDTWTMVVDSPDFLGGAITYGGDRFFGVSVGGGTIYSVDGVTWVTGSGIKGTHRFTDVVWGKDRYVAVGACGTVAYSTDKGVTWTILGIKFSSLRSIAWSPNLSRFVAVGGGSIFYSSDAATWFVAESSYLTSVINDPPGCTGSSF